MSLLLIFFIFILFIIIFFFLSNQVFCGKCKIAHDMSGKLIIITGASGLGKFSALELVNKGAKVIFACRNEAKTKNIFKDIPEDKKN